MNCPTCGSVAVATQRFCDECGSVLDPGSAASASAVMPVGSGQAGLMAGVPVRTLPGTPILLGDGEVLWRQYKVLQLRTRAQGEGTLYVTDARVVFYARAKGRGTQRPSALVQQTKLEHVTGLAAYVTRQISLVLFLFAVWFGLLTIIGLAAHSWLLAVIFVAAMAGCVALLIRGAGNRGTVGVLIQSGASEASPIRFGQFGSQRGIVARLLQFLPRPLFWLFGVFTAFDVLFGLPGEDSDRVIAELGAVIFDLQSRGALADTHGEVGSAEGQTFGLARG
jgi:hypothetical protein